MLRRRPFPGSQTYWETRYVRGGNSGAGSYAQLAEFKAEVLNRLVAQHHIRSVIEFGCGDGNQLSLAHYPTYLGIDISDTAIALCRSRFHQVTSMRFLHATEYSGQTADLVISLDVIYHLVEDKLYSPYLAQLFSTSEKLVVLYCSNLAPDEAERCNATAPPHVRHRSITRDIADNFPLWRLVEHIPNRYPYDWNTHDGSLSDFFIYRK